MAHRAHSGFVLLLCSDWANTREFPRDRKDGQLESAESRVHGMVRFVRNHPANHLDIDPHVVRVEGPVEVIAQPSRTGALLTLNPVVIGPAAWCIVADVHSDCAGFSAAHLEHKGDQYEAQAHLVRMHAQRFIDNVAIQTGHPLRMYVTWTQFGEHKNVDNIVNLVDVTSNFDLFEDDSWRKNAPAGLFEDAMAFSR